MLYQRTLRAGEWDTISVRGKHLNLVLAAGTVRVSTLSVTGQTFASNLVSGMSPENLDEFQSVSVRSPIAQTIQLWAGSIPLTYAPDTSRQVGSNALSSFIGEVYSGSAEELVPAEVGRNRVTISPSEDILIGGTNLNAQNGIPVAAGSVFTFNTQGAVYGLELTGAYTPSIGVDVVAGDVSGYYNNDTIFSGLRVGYITRNVGGDDQVLALQLDGQTNAYSVADTGELTDLGTIGDFESIRGTKVMKYLNSMVWTSAPTGTTTKWIDVDVETLTETIEEITTATVLEFFDAFANKRVATDGTKLWYSVDGGAWTQSTADDPNGGSCYGVAISAAGHIYVLHTTNISKTVDNGANWTSITIPANARGGEGIAVNHITGRLYYCAATKLYASDDDGATWDIALNTDGAGYVRSSGGTMAVMSPNYLGVEDKNGDYLIALNPQPPESDSGVNIGDDGRVYFGSISDLRVVVGERKVSGGLQVAILTEVN